MQPISSEAAEAARVTIGSSLDARAPVFVFPTEIDLCSGFTAGGAFDVTTCSSILGEPGQGDLEKVHCRHVNTDFVCDVTCCYCKDCEPVSCENGAGGTSPAQAESEKALTRRVLATGWPLSNHTAASDPDMTECLRIYDVVRSTGVPNFLKARLPLPHSLNIPAWTSYLKGHSDVSLV
jgi:hypothetical protein